MPLPAGARFSEVNADLADAGAELVLDLLDRWRADVEIPPDEAGRGAREFISRTRRKPTFDSTPTSTAERAYRFIRGTREWGVPFELDAGDAIFIIEDALDYHDTARMAVPYEIDAERLWIRCSEGVLEAVGRLDR